MSIGELDSLISEANYLLVYIPIVNLVYAYSNSPSQQLLIIIIATCIVCTFFFNFTRGYPDDVDGSSDVIPNIFGYVYIISVLVWIILWAYSLFELSGLIGNSKIYADILFVGSITWALMLATHFVLDYLVEGYSNDIYKF